MYPSLAHENLTDVLRLLRTPNVGPITFFQLIARYKTAEKALEARPELSRRGGRRAPLTPATRTEAEQEIEAAERFGARFVLYGSEDYPSLLADIIDPPPVLTVLGNPALWNDRQTLAVVGSRNASANGCQLAGQIARDVGAQGIAIVSGMARGIDSYAHKASMTTGTIAVIAGGIDHVYPPENQPLYDALREKGAIVSEQPFGRLPFQGSFPGRNRIISGMSTATLVVEASLKSGSLITARFATEQGREVMAIPGSPLDPRAKGCNHLLKSGAALVESGAEVCELMARLRLPAFSETPPLAFEPAAADEAALARARAQILEKLGITPVSLDELLEQCHISAPLALTVLLELELAGAVRRDGGNRIALAIREEKITA